MVACAWLIAGSSVALARAPVMLQGFYWDVPSPAAGDKLAPWWWDQLASEAEELGRSGFTSVWIPPVLKGASGGFSVGYDPFDDYDLGSKDQRGTVPTRYGTREQLERSVAVMRANGLAVYVDLVLNHRNGDPGNYTFAYNGAGGVPGTGRFPKSAKDFHPNVPQDPDVPADIASFGRDVAHVNGARIGEGLKDSVDWMTRALDVQGYRLDYVKGISCTWLMSLLREGSRRDKFAVAEFWDGDDKAVADYVQSCMAGCVSAFDFPLRYLLRDMCRANGSFDMRRLHRGGFTGRDASHSVTFVDNHDTIREDPVPNKAIAYACILTSEGTPCVFYQDYSVRPGCLGLKPDIDRLIAIRNTFDATATRERWKDDDVFVYERTRDGQPALLVGLNDSPSVSRTVTPATGWGPGVILHDYTGHAPDVATGDYGVITLTVPANSDGHGYVCYAPAGRKLIVPPPASYTVTQVYEGAADLDIPPVGIKPVTPVRVFATGLTAMKAELFLSRTDWTVRTRVRLRALGPDGRTLGALLVRRGSRTAALRVTALRTGWYSFDLQASSLPAGRRALPYRLRVTYAAPKRL
ncbi:MAG: hypothetical protein IT209_12900 [Armatimonadetes bacterium]|nr:hypothetical protein [Armatimonadota bacterium]